MNRELLCDACRYFWQWMWPYFTVALASILVVGAFRVFGAWALLLFVIGGLLMVFFYAYQEAKRVRALRDRTGGMCG